MKKITFKLNHNFATEDETVEFLENNVDFKHIYDVSEPRKVSKKPPIPFSTSGLQQKSSNAFITIAQIFLYFLTFFQ